MPALANPNQKRMRASIARMIAHMTIGLGITSLSMLGLGQLHAQTCDRCAGLASPNCGCEFASSTASGPKRCACKCVPKQSLGEKLLGQLERFGDRIEANARNSSAVGKCQCDQDSKTLSNRAPTCGCETSEPSCGCEYGPGSADGTMHRSQYAPSQVPILRPSTRNAMPFSNGSQDGTYSAPPIPKSMNTQPRATLESATTPTNPKFSTPSLNAPEPKVQRVPLVEPNSTKQYTPSTLKPTPFDPPPEYVPKPSQPKPKSAPNLDPNMPDVLVDPFKDDASFRGTRIKKEGVLLTSGRRTSNNDMKSSVQKTERSSQPTEREDREVPGSDGPSDRRSDGPSELTTSQRQSPTAGNGPSLQFEASVPSSGEQSRVVSSSYMEALPVKVVRRATANPEVNDFPQVPKVRVPQKR